MRDLLSPSPEQLRDPGGRQLLRVATVTAAGFALYGFTVGFWRSPLMGLYVAIKMPLLIAATLACNGLFNGLFAMVLGSGLGFRQSLQSLLGAFAISSLVLASIAPATFFLALNAPPPDSPQSVTAHAGYLLAHTALVAIAGSFGVLRLRKLLLGWCPTAQVAYSTLTAWIAGNAFIGAQLSWILRPFFGSPGLEVAFLRENPMERSFYESVWRSAATVLSQLSPGQFVAAAPILLLFIAVVHATIQQEQKPPSP